MYPTLTPEVMVYATGLFLRLRMHDVVIVKHEGLEKVKRIKEIHKGQIFIVGDNHSGSTDSRSFGWLSKRKVLGKVVWPRV